jgi:hypothetical protein
MSHLETGKNRFNWVAAPVRSSIPRTPGCVQCGSRLEMSERGKYSLSGKCFNCTNRNLEDDGMFEDYEE